MSQLASAEDLGFTVVLETFSSAAENLTSATFHPTFISEHLSACVADGQFAGPFDLPPFANFMSSRIGTVSKKNGKLILIHHLSTPVTRSINNGIDKEDYSLHYINVDGAIEIIMQHPTFTSSRTLPAITALGQSAAPTGSPARGHLLNKTAASPGWNCMQSFSPELCEASAGSASESASTQTTRMSRPWSDPARVAAKMSCLYSDHFSDL